MGIYDWVMHDSLMRVMNPCYSVRQHLSQMNSSTLSHFRWSNTSCCSAYCCSDLCFSSYFCFIMFVCFHKYFFVLISSLIYNFHGLSEFLNTASDWLVSLHFFIQFLFQARGLRVSEWSVSPSLGQRGGGSNPPCGLRTLFSDSQVLTWSLLQHGCLEMIVDR